MWLRACLLGCRSEWIYGFGVELCQVGKNTLLAFWTGAWRACICCLLSCIDDNALKKSIHTRKYKEI